MLSTAVLITSLLLSLVGSIVLWAAFLNFGLAWAGVKGATWRRALAVGIAVLLLGILLQLGFAIFEPRSQPVAWSASVAMLAAIVAMQCFLISLAFQLRPLRSLQAWLPTLAPTVVLSLFASLIFKPLLFQAYYAPTNSMAPTLLGNHCVATCRDCGQPCYCSPGDGYQVWLDMICPNFHVTRHTDVKPRAFKPDRFLVCRFLEPRRWDIVAFKVPWNPESLYVKRLVGVPGETIVIKEGTVWANGQRLARPNEIEKVRYLSELPSLPLGLPALFGSEEQPAELGDDEYFVLGDFSAQANDSRLWETGAPGHNAYAVPRSHIVGVVTHIYWPPQRWRVFR